VDARQRAVTYYALTDQRVIIISGLFSRQVKSLPLRTLSDLSLTEKSAGRGTITFGAAPPWATWMSSTPWPGMSGSEAPSFDDIPNVRDVYNALQNAQRTAA
jgi:hypothetical protein